MSGSMLLNEQLICTVRVANLYRIRNSDDINSNIIQFGVGEWMLYEMGKSPCPSYYLTAASDVFIVYL